MSTNDMESDKKRIASIARDASVKIATIKNQEKKIDELRRLSFKELNDLSCQLNIVVAQAGEMTVKSDTNLRERIKAENLCRELEKSLEKQSKVNERLSEAIECEKIEKQQLLSELEAARERQVKELTARKRNQTKLENKQKESQKKITVLESEVSKLTADKLELERQLHAAREKDKTLEVKSSVQPKK